MSFHSYSMKSITGEAVSFNAFKGKTCLVVNVASACGMTPQYSGLVELHNKYSNENFTVLGFPCNQFGSQEPGTDAEVCEFAQGRYNVNFPMFSKVEVNGPGACELYRWLTSSQPTERGTTDVRWNFTKFLVDGEGNAIRRFEPRVTPEQIDTELESILK